MCQFEPPISRLNCEKVLKQEISQIYQLISVRAEHIKPFYTRSLSKLASSDTPTNHKP
jgi:hypothetical protein